MKKNLIAIFLKPVRFHWKLGFLHSARLLLALGTAFSIGLLPSMARAQSALEVGANTTIYFSDTLNPLVWEDKEGNATLEQVRKRLSDFKPADTIGPIDPKSQYWVVQKLVNRIGENRDFIVDASRTDKGINWVR